MIRPLTDFGGPMSRLKVDEVRRMLPELEELRPLLDAMIKASEPDSSWHWASAGVVDTVGGRLIQTQEISTASASLAALEQAHIASIYGAVSRSVECMAQEDAGGAAAALLEAARLEEMHERPARAAAYASSAYRAARSSGEQNFAAVYGYEWYVRRGPRTVIDDLPVA